LLSFLSCVSCFPPVVSFLWFSCVLSSVVLLRCDGSVLVWVFLFLCFGLCWVLFCWCLHSSWFFILSLFSFVRLSFPVVLLSVCLCWFRNLIDGFFFMLRILLFLSPAKHGWRKDQEEGKNVTREDFSRVPHPRGLHPWPPVILVLPDFPPLSPGVCFPDAPLICSGAPVCPVPLMWKGFPTGSLPPAPKVGPQSEAQLPG